MPPWEIRLFENVHRYLFLQLSRLRLNILKTLVHALPLEIGVWTPDWK